MERVRHPGLHNAPDQRGLACVQLLILLPDRDGDGDGAVGLGDHVGLVLCLRQDGAHILGGAETAVHLDGRLPPSRVVSEAWSLQREGAGLVGVPAGVLVEDRVCRVINQEGIVSFHVNIHFDPPVVPVIQPEAGRFTQDGVGRLEIDRR